MGCPLIVHGISMMFIDFQWNFNDFQLFSLISMIFNGFHGFSMDSCCPMDFH